MNANLLSMVIGSALLLGGVVGCDDNKPSDKVVAPSAAAATSPETNKQKQEVKQRDPESIINAKMQVYIECFNDMDSTLYVSIRSYAS